MSVDKTSSELAKSRTPQTVEVFPSRRFCVGLAIAIIFLDQLTKILVQENIPLHSSVSVINGFFDLTHIRNTGVAFGFLDAVNIPFKPALMTAISLIALIAIIFFTSQVSQQERISKLGLTLILGGAIGNLIDRVVNGYVVDFIDVYWGTWHFWAFNVADSAISIGTCCLIIDMAILNRHAS